VSAVPFRPVLVGHETAVAVIAHFLHVWDICTCAFSCGMGVVVGCFCSSGKQVVFWLVGHVFSQVVWASVQVVVWH
jgi:hypothetical protein